MLLWIIFAVMTAAALAAVLAPLARIDTRAQPADDASIAVYRDQLEEVEADRARGIIDVEDAEAAKLEISRRVLTRAGVADSASSSARSPGQSRFKTAAAVALLVPLLTIGLYLAYGSPGMPAFPVSAHNRLPAEQAGVAELVARVETRLREHPEDGEGWEAIAPVYLKLGRYRDAAGAYARAAQLRGESVKLLAGFADATMLASDGIVTEDARRALEKILKLEPGRFEARFWLTLAKEQDGKLTEALSDYRALLADAPADAPWRAPLAERIEEVNARIASGGKITSPGPTAEDVAAAEKLSAEDRSRMIAGMVDGLARRLKQNGQDLPGWRRLVNAYVVLDRKDDAREALAEARRNFAGNERALGELSALAASLGLGS